MTVCPTEPCVICGKLVYTCELTCKYKEHHGGCELTGNGWVCSEECWDAVIEREEKP